MSMLEGHFWRQDAVCHTILAFKKPHLLLFESCGMSLCKSLYITADNITPRYPGISPHTTTGDEARKEREDYSKESFPFPQARRGKRRGIHSIFLQQGYHHHVRRG